MNSTKVDFIYFSDQRFERDKTCCTIYSCKVLNTLSDIAAFY